MLASPGELSFLSHVWPGEFTASLRPAALAKALAVSSRGNWLSVRNPPGLFCQPCARSVPHESPPHPPGNLHRYQNKGVAKFDCWNLLKTHELTKGKKGKSMTAEPSPKPLRIQKARK